MKRVDDRGLFELRLTRRKKWFTYRLRITHKGHTFEQYDAFQFGARAFADFDCTSETLYRNFGAQLCSARMSDGQVVSGVRFAVYAPNARSVSVIGDFNQWDGRRHPMMSAQDGIWRLFVPEIGAGAQHRPAGQALGEQPRERRPAQLVR